MPEIQFNYKEVMGQEIQLHFVPEQFPGTYLEMIKTSKNILLLINFKRIYDYLLVLLLSQC